MKKLLIILGLTSSCAFAAIASNLLVQFKGAYSSSGSYRLTPIKGIPYYACPEVTYAESAYVCNGSAQPNTAESTPDHDPAYTVLP